MASVSSKHPASTLTQEAIAKMGPEEIFDHFQELLQEIDKLRSDFIDAKDEVDYVLDETRGNYQLLLYRTAQIIELQKIMRICLGRDKAAEYFELLPQYSAGTYHMFVNEPEIKFDAPDLPHKPNLHIV